MRPHGPHYVGRWLQDATSRTEQLTGRPSRQNASPPLQFEMVKSNDDTYSTDDDDDDDYAVAAADDDGHHDNDCADGDVKGDGHSNEDEVMIIEKNEMIN